MLVEGMRLSRHCYTNLSTSFKIGISDLPGRRDGRLQDC